MPVMEWRLVILNSLPKTLV